MFAVVAVVTFPSKPLEVCLDLHNVVQAYDAALAAANPEAQFTSEASALDQTKCPGGSCPCAGLRRRLLGALSSCELRLRTIQTAAEFAVPEAYIVAVQRVASCPTEDLGACFVDLEAPLPSTSPSLPPPTGAIAGAVAGALVLALAAAALWYRRSAQLRSAREAKWASNDAIADVVTLVHSGRAIVAET